MRRSDSGSKADEPGLDGVTSLRVRYGETDAMGWVYYGTYFLYFEVGRTELIRAAWRAYREIEDSGLRLPVVQAHCRYVRGAKYDDVLDIHSRMTLPSAFRVRFDYAVRRQADQELLAEGFTEHCFVSSAGSPVKIPADLRALVPA
ncbi:MAG TPA: thioesterase family protein [bacterium]|jgi:acyl-CoA thioester hydrolase